MNPTPISSAQPATPDAPGAETVIEVRNLVFEYPACRALEDVSFSVARGTVTALVGPNGAGKTTLLACLAALRTPSAGTLRVAGVDVLEQPRECHRRVGYLCDFYGLYDDLTVHQCLLHTARAHGIPRARCQALVERAAASLSISDYLGAAAGTLSRGLRQRLAIAQAIIHEPSVLLLDEPASGLDPEARHQLALLMLALRDQGMTLLVSSHILAELEAYSGAMLILREGRLVESGDAGTPENAGWRLELELHRPAPGLAAFLEGLAEVGDVRVRELGATFRFNGGDEDQHRLLKALLDAELPVMALARRRQGMQEEYLAQVAERGTP